MGETGAVLRGLVPSSDLDNSSFAIGLRVTLTEPWEQMDHHFESFGRCPGLDRRRLGDILLYSTGGVSSALTTRGRDEEQEVACAPTLLWCEGSARMVRA